MKKLHISTKRIQINNANARLLIIAAVASMIVAFSLVGSRSLIDQRSYQARVIAGKDKAVSQLRSNVDAVKKLESAYQVFQSKPVNIIGGNPAGTGDRDGDNSKIILDSLPSQYDFPALTTSLEKLLSAPEYKIESIVGVDDEVNQRDKGAKAAAQSSVDMPFVIQVSGTYSALQALVDTLNRSIRPFEIQRLEFSGKDADLRLQITAKSFYEPEKSLVIKSKVVK